MVDWTEDLNSWLTGLRIWIPDWLGWGFEFTIDWAEDLNSRLTEQFTVTLRQLHSSYTVFMALLINEINLTSIYRLQIYTSHLGDETSNYLGTFHRRSNFTWLISSLYFLHYISTVIMTLQDSNLIPFI
jgi:hypothetical protein